MVIYFAADEAKLAIRAAISYIEDNTCIKFTHYVRDAMTEGYMPNRHHVIFTAENDR